MASADYAFLTPWRVDGPPEDAYAVIADTKSLPLELRRRRARTPEERAQVPPPPGPTFPHRRPADAGDTTASA
jgi:hypothetical protein